MPLCLQDPDVPVFLLRNVCFFCDSNGIQTVAQSFDKCNTKALPYNVAHTLITLIANVSNSATEVVWCIHLFVCLCSIPAEPINTFFLSKFVILWVGPAQRKK